MRTLGILGKPLGHSLSKAYFDARIAEEGLADWRFEQFEEIDKLLNVSDLAGFCVTIPYKKAIMARLDEISAEARAVGAVNCVRVRNGVMTGYNTDTEGFRVGLKALLGDAKPTALVLGTGGAAAAVRYVLEGEGINYTSVSRNGGGEMLRYEEVTHEILGANRLIINTTPLGMWPEVERKPELPYEAIGEGHFLYDLVYNPAQTAFLKEGAKRGARTQNGRAMFEAQAEENWRIWRNLTY